jgi:hypothetical protein
MSGEHVNEHENDTIEDIPVPQDEPAAGGKGAKRATDPTFKRNMIILGVFVLVMVLSAVGVVSALLSKAHPKNQSADVHMNTSTLPSTADDKTPLSPAMRDAAASDAAAEFQHQKDQGQHVILPQEPDNKVVSTNNQAARPYAGDNAPLTQEQLAAQRAQEQHVQDLAQQQQQQQQARLEGMQLQLNGLIAARDMGPAITRVVLDAASKTGQGSSDGSAAGGANAASGAASGSVPTGPVIAKALELFIGETANAIDTYRTDFCSSQIVSGKLKGAYLKGKCTQKDEGLSMHFTEMSFKGEAYAIDATGMDETTSSDAMSNIDIDRRYLQRYVFPITVAAINGAATVLGQPATTTTSTGGAVLSSTAAASKNQAIAAGVGTGVGVLQAMAQTAAQKPVQIKMDDRSPIGIMFNKPVRDLL